MSFLRAIAVIAVILFHLGYLPNGYLGVDIFFVISGFLITSIVYYEAKNKKFSTLKFYERRIRRIIPLLLVTSTTALILGLFFMLPDDLENLGQSVVASNVSLNNVLMLITSSDYWAVRNEYKPLMHTWSLGIEEQFYIFYPVLFFILSGTRLKYIHPTLITLSILSLFFFIIPGNTASKFYLLHYRFFELSIGGISAIYFSDVKKIHNGNIYLLYIASFFLLLILIAPIGSNLFKVLTVAILTTIILSVGKYFYEKDLIISTLFSNKILVFVGKISFSLYMWHQIVFAYARYRFFNEINIPSAIFLSIITIFLSIVTYYFIENPFRNKNKFKMKYVMLTVGILFLISTSSAFYIYSVGGIIKDYPALDLYKADNSKREINSVTKSNNINIKYNSDIRKLDRPFKHNGKPRILVIGNSYGRDVSNILLESTISNSIDFSYFASERTFTDIEIKERWLNADLVIIAAELFVGYEWIHKIEDTYNFKIDTHKLYCFGTKDFGYSNGIHYSRIDSISDFSTYYTEMKDGIAKTEKLLKTEWGDKYISLIEPVSNSQNKVLVFTPEGKFISQDTDHLTTNGAKFYAKIMDYFLSNIIKEITYVKQIQENVSLNTRSHEIKQHH